MRKLLCTLVALASLAFAAPASAADVTIKFATLAPENTVWYRALKEMGDKWTELSDGKVVVKIYAGGVIGNETAMVRKMRIGQLHGGQITNLGLKDYDPGPQALQMPVMIRDYEELDYLMEKMGPGFESKLSANGIEVLNWGDAGWVHVFANAPLSTPDQCKNHKIYAFDGEPEATKMFSTFGFEPVVLGATDVLPSLQSGLINAFPSTRLGALSLQWFALAPHMLDVPWAPLMGATVITNDAWAAIPAEFHEQFKKVAGEIGASMTTEIRRQDEKAVTVMKKFGLTVHSVDETTRKQWEALGAKTWPHLRGTMVPADVFDEMKGLLDARRAGK